MDKICYLSHHTSQTIVASEEHFEDENLFPFKRSNDDVDDEEDESFKEDEDSLCDDDDLEDEVEDELDGDSDDEFSSVDDNQEEDSVEEESGSELSLMVLKLWNKRKAAIESDYAITAWCLSIVPEVMDDVKERMDGHHHLAVQ